MVTIKTFAVTTIYLILTVSIGQKWAEDALAQEPSFYQGRIELRADRTVISIDPDINGLSFDTTVGPNEKRQYPEWMFLGDVKVDSIIYRDSVRLLYDSTQLTGIEVSSDTLLGIFSEAKVYRILKLVPTFEPSDTLYWDSIRIRWHTLPDLLRGLD